MAGNRRFGPVGALFDWHIGDRHSLIYGWVAEGRHEVSGE